MLAAELLTPGVQLALALAGLQPVALPDGVIGVAHGQGRQFMPPIQLTEFIDHHLHRPTVSSNVMHGQYQHVLIGRDLEQQHAQQRPRAQVERLAHFFGHLRVNLRG